MPKLTKPARDQISATKFAFPKQRKEPLENASRRAHCEKCESKEPEFYPGFHSSRVTGQSFDIAAPIVLDDIHIPPGRFQSLLVSAAAGPHSIQQLN